MPRLIEARRVPVDDLEEFGRRERSLGHRVVLTNGCFDLLHPGHIAVIRAAADLGETLVVAVNSDDSVRRLKGPDRPVMNLDDRLTVLQSLRWIDMVVGFDQDTASELIEMLRPDCYVKGADYGPKPGTTPLPEWPTLQRLSVEVVFVPLLPGSTSTNLISRYGNTS
ncbi:MAG TPA: D-glycero-beta-D-manno-heptose 1-phosphate adenylyltransferase [Chloroflexi bacterium]|nr:D-glycero-beta-D-manno-heptose 1-phosphate adenylyltransferase [Chloroflexota bacterium]|tara:strand:+ start:3257 stop:3757 length:501 start_codon:yes stop_codon:yes gene_type:complete